MHDTAPNGAGQRQPPWCGVDRTVRYIKRNHQSFEVLNFTPMKNFQIGTGLAVLKKNLDFKKIKKSDPSINFKPPVTSGKTWDYLYTKQFFLRQRLVASLLEDSNFVLDVGCFPVSVGEYLNHDRYLAVDPLFPGQTENIRNCLLSDISFDKDRDYDIVLLGIDIPVDQNLIDFCCRAQKVVIEWPICYAPSAEKVKSIVRNTKKNLSYDFTMDFSKLPVKIDPAKSWPPRYMRRIIILE